MTIATAPRSPAILNGLKAFRQFLNQHRSTLGAAPVLLVESEIDRPDITNKTQQQQQSEIFKHVQLVFTSLGIRTATAHPSSSYFPFVDDIPKHLELAQRIGAATVVGVGSSGGIELAKALAQQGQDFEFLMMVPGTQGATMLASASHSLLMDPSEPALMAHPTLIPPRPLEKSNLVLLESSLLSEDKMKSVVYSALVIAIDELCRGRDNPEVAIINIRNAVKIIQQIDDGVGKSEHDALLQQIMVWAGSTLSFGFAGESRSIPVALAISLVPTEFSDDTLFGFISCLLPGMLKVLEGTQHRNIALEISKTCLHQCPRLNQATGDDITTQGMISRVHANQFLWGCMDAEDSIMEVVLDASLETPQ